MVPGAYGGWKPDPWLPPARISWPSVCCELGAPLAAVADHADSDGQALEDLNEVAEPLSHLILVDGLESRRFKGANEGGDVLGRLGRRASFLDVHRPILSRNNRDAVAVGCGDRHAGRGGVSNLTDPAGPCASASTGEQGPVGVPMLAKPSVFARVLAELFDGVGDPATEARM
jgi:hypothetical protein